VRAEAVEVRTAAA